MLQIETIKTELFDANSYLVYRPEAASAVVIDPGFGAATQIGARLEELGKTVGAVVLTHGHPDHVWDASAVSQLSGDGKTAPVYIPGPDFDWLNDPLGKLEFPGFETLPIPWVRPAEVRELPLDSWQAAPGIFFHAVPSPGHSQGSCVLLVAGPAGIDGSSEAADPLAFSGDVVFAGSVGRTDLPEGDELEMRQSLRTLVSAMDPTTVLLPGHGPRTVWSEEIETNPYVRRARGA